jgi:hypothetical protein
VISSSQRPLSDNTQHSQETNIHAACGIQTHIFGRRAAAEQSPTAQPLESAFILVTGYKQTELSWRNGLIARLELKWEDNIRLEIKFKELLQDPNTCLNFSNILLF